jgi:hypothetical protein
VDRPAVHGGAVLAVQILERRAADGDDEAGVMPRDRRRVDPDDAVVIPADEVRAIRQTTGDRRAESELTVSKDDAHRKQLEFRESSPRTAECNAAYSVTGSRP